MPTLFNTLKLSVPLTTLLLAGCASISKEECLVADWYAMGVTDGSQGRALAAFRDYQADCAKHQLSSDFEQYQAGHQQGVVNYCVYSNGVALGRQGNNFNTLCESERFEDFQEGYFQGQQLHQMENKLAKLRRDMASIESRIEQNQQQLKDNQASIIDENSTKTQREELLKDNDRLRRDIRRLKTDLGALAELEEETDLELSHYLNSIQL
ncbi:DUF2799 domain-containing protein [Bowmanella yangjiangensis]|uniref:DUF2799 domain-containing protein n=1 Tax=Bowmanella yangjiangensis TaxID=2811230 RepID=A0ABS3CSD8_9ALTE|nr:DUF2799 domain-containing protein [Bowmanella yangjiangensis]MBN7820032.1 DUF2799 domain-containing protein [Bowmanella yangjiangensis]